ncbi:hypothetical protein GCM10018966_030960 [Streptomyces yanii]
MSGIRGLAVPGGVDPDAVVVHPGRQPLPSMLQAVLILVRVLFVVTVVGAIDVLSVASSVDAVDGRLLGMLLYAVLPGAAGFVLSLYVRTGGAWTRRGLLAVHVWLALGALATLSEDGGRQGVPQLVVPVVVVGLLLRRSLRAWFDLDPEQRAAQRPFILARVIRARRDRGQTAMEYLGAVLVVVALVGALMATQIGGQLTGGIRSAICQLTGSACPAAGSGVVAGHGTDGGGASGGGGTESGGVDSGGSTVAGGTSSSGGSPASGGDGRGGAPQHPVDRTPVDRTPAVPQRRVVRTPVDRTPAVPQRRVVRTRVVRTRAARMRRAGPPHPAETAAAPLRPPRVATVRAPSVTHRTAASSPGSSATVSGAMSAVPRTPSSTPSRTAGTSATRSPSTRRTQATSGPGATVPVRRGS